LKITLYEYGATRSVRVRWTLLELGLDFESKQGRELIGSEELRKVHPQGKLPAAVIDGRPLFESVAICNHLADSVPEKGLIPAAGTWDRALHDQWTSFALTELEAWLWSNAKHQFFYPEEMRVPGVVDANKREVRAALEVLEAELAQRDHLVGDAFSLTDILVSYTVNWARRARQLGDFPSLQRYLERLWERPACALPRE
jgi:glutathione S-transferase